MNRRLVETVIVNDTDLAMDIVKGLSMVYRPEGKGVYNVDISECQRDDRLIDGGKNRIVLNIYEDLMI